MVSFKSLFVTIIASFFFLPLFGQDDVYKYLIYLTDKDNSPYSIDQPNDFLSEAALARRNQYNIPVKENDLPVLETYQQNLRDLGYHIISTSKWLNAVLVETDWPIDEVELEEETYIKDAVWVALYREGGRSEITTPFIDNEYWQVSHSQKYGQANDQIKILNGQFLHNNDFKGEEMVIGVIDAGFDKVDELEAFENLRSEGRIVATRDFVDYDDNVYEASFHGMSVLSTMAAVLNQDYLGTAPKANYVLIRTEDVSSEQLIEEYNYVLGLEYADQMGVDVVTTSLGYTTFNQALMDHDTTELDGDHLIATVGADIAASKGMLIINSAGNKGNSTWKHISFPSDGDSVLAVGSVNKALNRSGFSGIGFEESEQVKPNVMALGEDAAVIRSDGSIGLANGTSFSAPILAGLVACLWQAFPEKNNMEIIKAVEESSSQSRSPDIYMGYGIPDFQAAFALLYQDRYDLNSDLSNILIFPNPFNNHITLTIPESVNESFTITLVNDIGQQLHSEQIDAGYSKTIDLQFPNLESLNKGLYFLKVKTNEEIFVFKMVKV